MWKVCTHVITLDEVRDSLAATLTGQSLLAGCPPAPNVGSEHYTVAGDLGFPSEF